MAGGEELGDAWKPRQLRGRAWPGGAAGGLIKDADSRGAARVTGRWTLSLSPRELQRAR